MEALRQLVSWLDVEERVAALRTLWSPHARAQSARGFSTQLAHYKKRLEILEAGLELERKSERLRVLTAGIAGLREPDWSDLQGLRTLREAAEAVQLEEALGEASRVFDRLAEALRPFRAREVDPFLRQLAAAIHDRDRSAYAEAYQRITANHTLRKSLARREALLDRLRISAPQLAVSLAEDARDPAWDRRTSAFGLAWVWALARGWIERLSDANTETQLALRMDAVRSRIRKRLEDLAAAKAWAHCFGAMKEHERQHLVAWSLAMRNLGKATGKYAPMHRRAARDHMAECRSAIPAWVMPIYRVAETIRPGTDLFDVMIVDEASQSGPEALLLTYLARRVVVVGDDKQIKPEFVGVDNENVIQLRERHIRGLPHYDQYGVDNSLFDLAEIRYQGRIRLREHFRCMPEIIQFSNTLCYRAEPLTPLKQYGSARLLPVVNVRHVRDGYVRGTAGRIVNEPEARALVEVISNCCNDPAYEGKTFGVISLQGEPQAHHIERLLLEGLGSEEMLRRKLSCGDSYEFQGDERDVVFLSLVAAPAAGQRIRALTSAKDERRFNVAASRAKEQMWLFHTATLNDLSPQCLRYRLLQYCMNPTVAETRISGISIEELRRFAASVDRDRTAVPDPFESWFELEVFLRIADRRYRVTPQYEIAGYRIDLVVEGLKGRLAVECDGDKWHGPERHAEDMARQRMLERCGWVFWRVRGSAFSLDPERAMSSLWDTLDRQGVYPEGQEPPSRSARHEGGTTPAPNEPADLRATPPRPRLQEGAPGPPESDDIRHTDAPLEKRQSPPASIASPSPIAQEGLADGPYRRWQARPLPDPGGSTTQELVLPLVEIIAAEGPMLVHRACRIFVKAAGGQRIGRQIREVLHAAIRSAIRMGHIVARKRGRKSKPGRPRRARSRHACRRRSAPRRPRVRRDPSVGNRDGDVTAPWKRTRPCG